MKTDRKIWLLVGGIVLAVFISYKLAFSKTLQLRSEVSQLKRNAIGLSELGQLNKQLALREKQIDSVLQQNNLQSTSIQNGLLNFLNQSKENSSVKIVSFDEPHRFEGDNGVRVSYTFELTGDYTDLLELIYGLEREVGYGSVKSLSFEKKRNYRRRIDFLSVYVVLEVFESN